MRKQLFPKVFVPRTKREKEVMPFEKIDGMWFYVQGRHTTYTPSLRLIPLDVIADITNNSLVESRCVRYIVGIAQAGMWAGESDLLCGHSHRFSEHDGLKERWSDRYNDALVQARAWSYWAVCGDWESELV